MPVTITIHGDNAAQAIAELAGLSASVGQAAPAPAPAEAEPVPEAERKAFPEPKAKRQPRAAKPVELEEVAVEDAPLLEGATSDAKAADAPSETESQPEPTPSAGTATPASDESSPDFTEDDTRRALSDLATQPDGKVKCREVLQKFGAAKISEIKPEDRKAFIAAIAKLRGIA